MRVIKGSSNHSFPPVYYMLTHFFSKTTIYGNNFSVIHRYMISVANPVIYKWSVDPYII
ncbi:hypothetical protein RG959_09635 [Domibacillus sp. 8LH]|uniref:hypothetical protein n=1 Tax=Domibacillus sp. 8LH TaxID=3073900 RepID=UPI003177F86A